MSSGADTNIPGDSKETCMHCGKLFSNAHERTVHQSKCTYKSMGGQFVEVEEISSAQEERMSLVSSDLKIDNSSGAMNTSGITNGLKDSKEVLTNKKTLSKNGLVNGLVRNNQGRANGPSNGKTNGITNGLTNGLRAMRAGITNGLTNGNGITNGLGRHKRVVEKGQSKWKFILLPAIIFILIATPFVVVNYSKAPEWIDIDGKFNDWKDVEGYSDENEFGLPDNIDIREYRVRDNGAFVFFYLKVEEDMLKGDSQGHVDTVHIFIDSDLDSDTGFLISGMGADYMIQIYGKDGRIYSSFLYRFTSSDQFLWNGFETTDKILSKVSGSQLEARLERGSMGLSKPAPPEVMYHISDNKGSEDFSDTSATNMGGVLAISQGNTEMDAIVSPDTRQHLLELNLNSINHNVMLRSVTVTKPTGTAAVSLQMEGHFSSSANFIGNTATFQINQEIETYTTLVIYADTSNLDGEAVGFRIEDKTEVVVESGIVFLTTDEIRHSYINAPDGIVVDGAFGDWNTASAPHDESGDVSNPNIDITNYYAANDSFSNTLYFYLKVEKDLMEGTLVPFTNSLVIGEPTHSNDVDTDRDTVPNSIDIYPKDFDNDGVEDSAEGGDVDSDGVLDFPAGEDQWLQTTIPSKFSVQFRGKTVRLYIGPAPEVPDVHSTDSAYVFLDTDGDSTTGYSIGNIALGADYLIEIKGKEGRIVSRQVNIFSGNTPLEWDWTRVDVEMKAEIDSSQMEISIDHGSMDIGNQMRVFYKTTDWKGQKDGSEKVLEMDFTLPETHVTVGSVVGPKFDPFVVRNQGDVYQSPDAAAWTFQGNPQENQRYMGIASGSGSTAGYVYVLRSDGKVYFTDRGVSGWNEYGYGSPPISQNTSYVDIAAGSGTSSGYVYVLRNDGTVFFTDRGTNGWTQYGYGRPAIDTSSAYVGVAAGSGTTSGYVYVLRNDGRVFFTDRGVNGWYQYGYDSPAIETSTAYVDLAAGSGANAGYVYVLRNDGTVFFTDRGVSGWNQYGYGSPAIESSTAYVSIAAGVGSTNGYVYVLRNDGKVFFTDRGVNGWNQYGYGSPGLAASNAYIGLAAGDDGTTNGYLFVLHSDGSVHFTDRGVSGWFAYGYGSPQLTSGVWYTGVGAYSETTLFTLLSNGTLFKSTDAGLSWSYFGDAGNDDDWVDVTVTFSENIYVLNSQGDIVRSPINSASWSAWGDAGNDTSWVSITGDSGGYLYALCNDGWVSYATESDNNWLSKGDTGAYTSWVAIAAYDGGAGSYVYAMRNNRSIKRALVGTSGSWSVFVSEGEDTSWVSLAADNAYIYALRNDGSIDRAEITSGNWTADFGDVGVGTSFVDISTVVSEFHIIVIPLSFMLIVYLIRGKRKRKGEIE